MDPPPQAVKAFLSTIEPCDPVLGWDEASCSRFVELVTFESKPFEFHVSKVVRSDNGQLLELHGLLLDDGIDVGGELVKEGYAHSVTAETEVLNSGVVMPSENYDAAVSIPIVVSTDDCESRHVITSDTDSIEIAVSHEEQSPQPRALVSKHDEYANEHDTVSKYTEELNAQDEEPSSYPLPNESDDRFPEDVEMQVEIPSGCGDDGDKEHELESTEVTLVSGEFAGRCDEQVEQYGSSIQQCEFDDDHRNESNESGINQCTEEEEESNGDVNEPGSELVNAAENFENGASSLLAEKTDVSNASTGIADDVCDKDRVARLLLNADDDDDDTPKQVSEARQMFDSAGTELVESACLDDTDSSSDTFRKC